MRGTPGLDRHRRQRLADLVVQLACHSEPLGLLRGERGAGRLAASVFQPVEHGVERVRHGLALHAAEVDIGQAAAWPVRINRRHRAGQLDQRGENPSQQQYVQEPPARRSRRTAARIGRSRSAHGRDRRQRQQQERHGEHQRVRQEDQPQQRDRPRARPGRRWRPGAISRGCRASVKGRSGSGSRGAHRFNAVERTEEPCAVVACVGSPTRSARACVWARYPHVPKVRLDGAWSAWVVPRIPLRVARTSTRRLHDRPHWRRRAGVPAWRQWLTTHVIRRTSCTTRPARCSRPHRVSAPPRVRGALRPQSPLPHSCPRLLGRWRPRPFGLSGLRPRWLQGQRPPQPWRLRARVPLPVVELPRSTGGNPDRLADPDRRRDRRLPCRAPPRPHGRRTRAQRTAPYLTVRSGAAD